MSKPVRSASTEERASAPKIRVGADSALIACVRARPVLYDPAHSRYMDNALKTAIWEKIGRHLRATPTVCKARWNNIRDNYRKSLRRRNLHSSPRYKYADLLGFMEPFYRTKDKTAKPGETDTGEHRTSLARGEDKDEGPVEDNDDDVSSCSSTEEETHSDTQTSEQLEVSNIKVDQSDVEADQTESMVDYEFFEKSASVSGSAYPAQAQAVDAFLAALAPPLKALSPYHLSLAKAEIFATVHKYELKEIVDRGWGDKNDNPLP